MGFISMFISPDIWKLLAGVAIFLLGMKLVEEALHQLAGRPFKLFLKKQTASKLKGITGGAIVAGLLQSSSVVNLMVLAFVGAGVIKMQSALAIVLGANLGSTCSNWIVAVIGFNVNIESFALPLTGVFGILTALIKKENHWHAWSRFLFGVGFLFVGLNFMKTGMEGMVKLINLQAFNQYPAVVFLLIGLAITTLIQSSSATMAIVLSALHAHAISLYAATAIVLGAEVGTTLKLVLASLNGSAAKKRVALGNLLFNIISICLVFVFLYPINRLIIETIGIRDQLIALVFFQTLVNAGGIILFYPFLNRFGQFLEKRFVHTASETLFINKAPVTDVNKAMAALEKETRQFMNLEAAFSLAAFYKQGSLTNDQLLPNNFTSQTINEKYESIKHLHGTINEYGTQLRLQITDKEIMSRLEQLMSVCRNTMYAAKNLKDAFPDIEQLRNSSNTIKYNFYRQTAGQVVDFYERIFALLSMSDPQSYSDTLKKIFTSVQHDYTKSLQELYNESGTKQLSEIEFSTLMNFNREIYTSFKSVLFGIKDYLLDTTAARYFDELPGFIR